ncbi:hypothetical protein FB567DRAFT_614190 [Paraphoma chrysanthemicola]|uniref:RING-type domain-containing protein n=1 Tax=Paraphoma chrysanthemicola TaxID=798071 RepID=A0A8K0RDE9_9PLEO|nr:hypothetical protein FB567DRAFT_614190 [Paraphoma chrysanthemicola]
MAKLQRELAALDIPPSGYNLQRSNRKARPSARTAAAAAPQGPTVANEDDNDTGKELEEEQHEGVALQDMEKNPDAEALPLEVSDQGPTDQQSNTAPPVSASSDSVTVHDEDAADLDPDRRECLVCLKLYPIADFPHLKDCKQQPTTCRTCFANWLSNEVGNTASLSQVRCPCESQDCKVPFTWEDARGNASPEVFARYDHLHVLERSAKIQTSGTASLATVHLDNSTAMTMAISSSAARADIYDERERLGNLPHAEQELASKAALEKISTQCPGAECGYWIQKTAGCDHMTCTRCGFQFCYLCSAPYKGVGGIHSVGNAAHEHRCAHHTKNIMGARRDSTDSDDRVDSSEGEDPSSEEGDPSFWRRRFTTWLWALEAKGTFLAPPRSTEQEAEYGS